MDSSPSPQTQPPVRAESFYLDDDPMVIFLVENQLFKVHRHFFIQGSEIFRDMFFQAQKKEGGAGVEGTSDDNPIKLPEVTVKEFRTLLRLFYAMASPIPDKNTLADVLAFELDEKLALLSIAHRFVFDEIFEYVYGLIEPKDVPVEERISLGDKYHLKEWLHSAYKAILERTSFEKLTPEEADALGLERAVMVLEVMISMLHTAYSPKTPNHLIICACTRQLQCTCCSQWSMLARTAIEAVVEAHCSLLTDE